MNRRDSFAAAALAPFLMVPKAGGDKPGVLPCGRYIYRQDDAGLVPIAWNDQKPGDFIVMMDWDEQSRIESIQTYRVQRFDGGLAYARDSVSPIIYRAGECFLV